MTHLLGRLLREPTLSAERERSLAVAARAGDGSAREALVRESLRLVALRVAAMGFRGQEVDDALQEGAIALLAAVDRFDPDRGVRLATFAWPRVEGALRRHRAAAAMVRPTGVEPSDETVVEDDPASLALLASALSSPDATALALRHGLPPWTEPRTWAEVAECLGVSESTARRRGTRAMSRMRRRLASIGDRAPGRGADPP